MRPLISVAVLAYNHEPYLAEALTSVLGQRGDFDLEVLVGEDCSTDRTAEVAARCAAADARVRIISAPTNVGMHANHHRLVRAARGEFLAYCEGDDYWNTPDKLAVQLGYLQAHPDLVGVHTDFDHIRLTEHGWRRLDRRHRLPRVGVVEDDQFATLLTGNFIQTVTILARTERVLAYVDSPFAAATYRVEDWPMFLYLTGTGGRFGYLPLRTATYRLVPGSVTNSGPVAQVRTVRDHLRMARDFCDAFDVPHRVREQSLASLGYGLLVCAVGAGDTVARDEALAILAPVQAGVALPRRAIAQAVRNRVGMRAARLAGQLLDGRRTARYRDRVPGPLRG